MTKMVDAGMNVARINFSHATDEEKENVVKTFKEEAIKVFDLKENNNIIITGGFNIQNKEQTTNFLKIEKV